MTDNYQDPAVGARAHFNGGFLGTQLTDVSQKIFSTAEGGTFSTRNLGEILGIGEYPKNTEAFPLAIANTFDSLAVDAGVKCIIYSGQNFSGDVLLEKTGPFVIYNYFMRHFQGGSFDPSIAPLWVDSEEVPQQPGVTYGELFPAEVRTWDAATGGNMHNWSSGSMKLVAVEESIATDGNYQDPGATASDAQDGNITNKITKTITKQIEYKGRVLDAPVDKIALNEAGRYTIRYNVRDSGGLDAPTKTRVVNILAASNISDATCDAETDYQFKADEYLTLTYDAQLATSVGQGPYTTPSWLDLNSDFPFGDNEVTSYGDYPMAINYQDPSLGTFLLDDIPPIYFTQTIELFPNGTAHYWRKNTLYHNFSQYIAGTWSGGGVAGDKPIQVKFKNNQPKIITHSSNIFQANSTTTFDLSYAVPSNPWGEGNEFMAAGFPHCMWIKQGASLGIEFGQDVVLCLQAPTQDYVFTKKYGAHQNPIYYDPQADLRAAAVPGWGGGHIQPNLLFGNTSTTVTKTLVRGEGLTLERPERKADFVWSMTRVEKPVPIDWSGVGGTPHLFLSGQLV